MKMLEYKNREIYDVGFVDPYIVNEIMLQNHPKDVEHDMYTFFTEQSLKREILFPYNFSWVFLSCTHCFFAYLMLSVIDELCMHFCRFHWILLKIQFDKSTVEVMDSLNKDEALWSDMKAMLQK
jgi:hypothetical protein